MKRKIICTLLGYLLLGLTLSVSAQVPQPHSGQHPGFQGPGYPGSPIQGYYQPVKIRGPEGTKIALATDLQFVQRQATPHAVGLLVGGDYRMRLTNIPFHPGKEVFPTVKVIARTFPPQGLELDYPILIDITQEDIELAMNGQFVTRVIYLENPGTAIPVRGDIGTQPSSDVVATADPMDVAVTMGQPVAIVRLGGRIPSTLGGIDPGFFHGCPSWLAFDRRADRGFDVSLYRNRTAFGVPVSSVLATVPEQNFTPATPRTAPSNRPQAIPIQETTPQLAVPGRRSYH